MKTKYFAFIIIFLMLCPFLLNSQSLYYGGHIPGTHQVDWHKAGLLKEGKDITPRQVFTLTDYSGNPDEQLLDALTDAGDHVEDTEGLAIIYFPEGMFYLTTTITKEAGMVLIFYG